MECTWGWLCNWLRLQELVKRAWHHGTTRKLKISKFVVQFTFGATSCQSSTTIRVNRFDFYERNPSIWYPWNATQRAEGMQGKRVREKSLLRSRNTCDVLSVLSDWTVAAWLVTLAMMRDKPWSSRLWHRYSPRTETERMRQSAGVLTTKEAGIIIRQLTSE